MSPVKSTILAAITWIITCLNNFTQKITSIVAVVNMNSHLFISPRRNHACSKQSSVEEFFDLPKVNFLMGESVKSFNFFNDDKFNPEFYKFVSKQINFEDCMVTHSSMSRYPLLFQ